MKRQRLTAVKGGGEVHQDGEAGPMAKMAQVGPSRHGVKGWDSDEKRRAGEEATYIDHAPRCQAAAMRFP